MIYWADYFEQWAGWIYQLGKLICLYKRVKTSRYSPDDFDILYKTIKFLHTMCLLSFLMSTSVVITGISNVSKWTPLNAWNLKWRVSFVCITSSTKISISAVKRISCEIKLKKKKKKKKKDTVGVEAWRGFMTKLLPSKCRPSKC